jgi:Arc/MetJ-type ribon-helix-helix transcriptional regulator
MARKGFEFNTPLGKAYVGVIGETQLENALGRFKTKGEGRGNVVMVRLGDEALAKADQLVEATLFSSRSEAAAFLVGAGIESQKELFDRLKSHTDEIRKLKEEIRKVALDALTPPNSAQM